jgi:chemotaxis protein methyltransferase CheR
MAMTAVEAFGKFAAPVHILATDVDTSVLATAQAGIYTLDRIDKLSIAQKRNFFRKGVGEREGLAMIKPELKNMIVFKQLNLLDNNWPRDYKFDAIFCRNVMIYFDKATQRKLLEKFVQVLQPDGLFFAGHSESFAHAGDLIAPVGKTVYRPGRRIIDGGRNGAQQ